MQEAWAELQQPIIDGAEKILKAVLQDINEGKSTQRDLETWRRNADFGAPPIAPATGRRRQPGRLLAEPGTPEWLNQLGELGGNISIGSVGLRAGAVPGETIGESLIAGLGGLSRAQREANVANNPPQMEAVLAVYGQVAAESVEQVAAFASKLLTGVVLTLATGGLAATGMFSGAISQIAGNVAIFAGAGAAGGFVYDGFFSGGSGGFDFSRAIAGAFNGAMIGAGLALGGVGTFVGSVASAGLITGGMTGFGAISGSGSGVDWGLWGRATLVGVAAGAAGAAVGYGIGANMSPGLVSNLLAGSASGIATNLAMQVGNALVGIREWKDFSVSQVLFAGAGGMVGGGISWGASRLFFRNGILNCADSAAFVLRHTLSGALGGALGSAADQIMNEGTIDPGTLLLATVMGGVSGRATARGIQSRHAACFAAGTPLLWEHGSKPIELFKMGERLWSRNEFDPDGPLQLKEIEEVFVRSAWILHLHVGGQVIKTTAEHPFYVRGKGWVDAVDLQLGDLLSSHDGQWLPVEEVYETGEYEVVYNLRVADWHTYFVGSDEWRLSVWAHNASCEFALVKNNGDEVKFKMTTNKIKGIGTRIEIHGEDGSRLVGTRKGSNLHIDDYSTGYGSRGQGISTRMIERAATVGNRAPKTISGVMKDQNLIDLQNNNNDPYRTHFGGSLQSLGYRRLSFDPASELLIGRM